VARRTIIKIEIVGGFKRDFGGIRDGLREMKLKRKENGFRIGCVLRMCR